MITRKQDNTVIIQVPANFISQYTTFIEQRGVEAGQHRYYVKWLRYYLDFCHKYNLIRTEKESIPVFAGKLKEKKQAENFRKQAHHAISLFYELEHCSGRKTPNSTSSGSATTLGRVPLETSPLCTQQRTTNQANRSSRTTIVHTAEPLPRTDIVFKQSGADWTKVFNELKNAITMRHYSPKTLKAYSGWTSKFQAYAKSKDPRLVSVDDVKNFLTWLAVGQGVSASSQNQAFNALLFLFRNVFHKEFGKIDGVVRAKRKPYYTYRFIQGGGCPGFDMKILTVHDGKGQKDRTVPIPEALMEELKAQLERVIELHEQDCQAGVDGVFLYGLLEKKYKNAARELVWQWFFPAKELTFVPKDKEMIHSWQGVRGYLCPGRAGQEFCNSLAMSLAK